jgi:pyruvate formate lyase activating enzyme
MEVMDYVGWVFVDIKHMDPNEHKKLTGVENTLILKNIRTLAAKQDWDGFIVPRIPIIPGMNDSVENISATAKFVKEIGLELINILPFHRLGESKYTELGKTYQFAEQKPPTDEHMESIKKIIEKEGLVCYIGYETPF